MKEYRVDVGDGRILTIEGPEDATDDELTAAAAEELARAYPKENFAKPGVKRAKPSIVAPEPKNRLYEAKNEISGKGGYQDLINNGATFGLSDEASGAANYLINLGKAGSYEEGRDAVRMRLDDARANTGWTGTVADIGGSIIGGVPKAGYSALLSLGSSVKNAAKWGAGLGAISGFGSGDGAVDSLVRSGVGGLAGGTFGAVLPIATQMGGRIYDGARRLFAPNTENLSRQIVGDAIAADGTAPAAVAERLVSAAGRGTPLAIADTGENVRSLAASVSRRPGPARTAVREFADIRQVEQPDRVLGAIENNLGPIANMRSQSDSLIQEGRAAAAPLYDEAYSLPARTSENLQEILQTPAGRQALARARTIAANERRDPTALGFGVDDQGEVVLSRVPTAQTLDYVKRGLDDIIEQGRDPVTRRLVLDEAGRAINDVRASLIREADALYPPYAAARQAYAGPAAAEDALQMGRSMLNSSADEIEAAVTRMEPRELEQFALGFRTAMADNVGRAGDGADQARRLLGTPRKRAAISQVFGGDENLSRFIATLRDEQATNATYRSVMGGSQTAERMAADAQTSDMGILEAASGAAIRGATTPVTLLGDALKSLGEVGRFGVGEAGDQTRQGVAALLTETDPAVLQVLAKAVKDATTRQRLTMRNRNMVSGNVGTNLGEAVSLSLPSE